jgi:glyceraldehyde-3-phosphate dehydrogenase/erythrose-4-phosphate dehydrogenase
MGIKVGINGFGRIGRNVMRSCLGDDTIDFVGVNDLTDTKTLAHLLKYDSIMGNLDNEISASGDTITVDGDSFKVFSEKDPAAIDWASVGAEIVIESTGQRSRMPRLCRKIFAERSLTTKKSTQRRRWERSSRRFASRRRSTASCSIETAISIMGA